MRHLKETPGTFYRNLEKYSKVMASWFTDALSSLVNISGASSSQPVQPKSLQADGMLSKAQLQAYFAECGAVLDDPGFRTKLKDAQLLNQDVPKLIDDMQRQILIKLGVDGGIILTHNPSTNFFHISNLRHRLWHGLPGPGQRGLPE